MKQDIIKQIFDVLKEDGTDVYFPMQKQDECKNKYIVVKMDGVNPTMNVSSERPIYTIMCYVPKNNYTMLEGFIKETKDKLKKLYPLIEYAGNETPSFYDDDVKAHMISFQYQGIRKILNR